MRYCSLIVAVIVAAASLAAFSCSRTDSDDSDTTADDDSADDDSDDSEDDDGDDGAADDDSSDDDTTDDFDPNIEGTWPDSTWIDKQTGLVWETFLSQSNAGTWNENADHCEELVLEGFDDWRLPSVSEYRSLIKSCGPTKTVGECPVTDDCSGYANCFDDSCHGCVSGSGLTQGCYWPFELSGYCGEYLSATMVSDESDSVWFVRFNNGEIDAGEVLDRESWVRCVRGEWFEPNIEGTETEPVWTDDETGLVWETFQSQIGGHPWQENKDHCENLVLGGYNDWRMPSISEYRSLIRGCDETMTGGECPASDECTDFSACYDDSCLGCGYAQGPAKGCYWPEELSGTCSDYMSATFNGSSTYYPWSVSFDHASINVVGSVEEYFGVRCVRGTWSTL